jgi:hypothetical protein
MTKLSLSVSEIVDGRSPHSIPFGEPLTTRLILNSNLTQH